MGVFNPNVQNRGAVTLKRSCPPLAKILLLSSKLHRKLLKPTALKHLVSPYKRVENPPPKHVAWFNMGVQHTNRGFPERPKPKCTSENVCCFESLIIFDHAKFLRNQEPSNWQEQSIIKQRINSTLLSREINKKKN